MKILYQDETIRVFDEKTPDDVQRILTFGPHFTIRQGFILLSDPRYVPSPAFQKLLFGASLAPRLSSALVLGLGVGSLPAALQSLHAGIDMDIVDFDPRIFEIATRFFHRKFPQPHCHCRDAEEYVATCARQYDYICIDIWEGDAVPDFVVQESFWRNVRGLLAGIGVVSVNANYFHHKRLCELLTQLFPRVLSLRDNNASLVLFASEPGAISLSAETCNRYGKFGADLPAILSEAIVLSRIVAASGPDVARG